MQGSSASHTAYEAGSKIWKASFLSGYNLCIFIGILMAFATVAYHWKRQKYSWENLQILMILIIPFSIFGARLYTVIFDGGWDNFFTFAGMSIYGGVIGAVIPASIYLYFRRNSLDYRTVLTIILPTVLIGQAIGRWGNFQNHEVYGAAIAGDASSLDWMTGLKAHMNIIEPPHYDWPAGIPQELNPGTAYFRQPMFFYESMLDLFAYIILVWALNDRNWLKPGVTAALYMISYGVIRLILQIFRDPSPMNTSYIGDSGIALNLVVSGLAISFGVLLALFWQFRFKLFTISGKDIYWGSKKKYELIKPKKEVRRFWVGKKYERTFNIWIPDNTPDKKWSKREINKGKRNKK